MADKTPARTAELHLHILICGCGSHHSLMNGQAGVTCSCGARFSFDYDRDYGEILSIEALLRPSYA